MTIDDKFKGVMEAKKGCVVIMAGSDSDEPHIQNIIKSLEEYHIPYETRICSAHKPLDTLLAAIKEYNAVDGLVGYVAVAGGTDALSGTLAWHALGPVVSCPPDAPNESCLTNPPGSSNAYIPKPKNVGRYFAQMFSAFNPELRELLQQKNIAKVKKLEEKDVEFRAKYRVLD